MCAVYSMSVSISLSHSVGGHIQFVVFEWNLNKIYIIREQPTVIKKKIIFGI